ncbi:proline--tRNA ligase [Candidatus Gottesmanbacteria bacterium RIFCSPHIGHO2_02_FULL_39_14]|uniref:Proline--tRNA ligase n=1 Tax=Candidatus Gottesmanbacteria bacterium RIFCSPHIGHO2_02_FULL_39_14 TaxID=1798383 RepID=A0A1F5ZWD5_9BACT|nr:MAG: proline--tRNA ligase [Candidatus Gottesmanbacteria bacterium RIFCSPHIGHO2_02_FULL_39_14]
MQKFEKKELKKKSENLSDWYNDVILKAELADYAPVKGCMIIRPYGYNIWENIQSYLDKKFKNLGVKNAYFPLFIPNSFLHKEKEHVEGFSPQLAVVTIGGGEKLKEPLIVRPTSETIMYDAYAKWINSWRDLPLLLNVWNNVIRWEKRTYLFLRTTEFLWQEGHTAHATSAEADSFARVILDIYKKFDEEELAVKIIAGEKSGAEKFAGAQSTYSLEALMPDGKALQMGTSHLLGDNFAKVFNIRYSDKEGKQQFVHQTSWAETTRVIGALVMVHGDDHGLILPPRIVPVQVAIVAIPIKSDQKEKDIFVDKIKNELSISGIRVEMDERYEDSVGRRFNYWEVKGVPLRIEIGEKEIKEGFLTVFRRDTFHKEKMNLVNFVQKISDLLDKIQVEALDRHRKFTEENTHTVDDYQEFKKIMKGKRGFIKSFWCENKECEAKIKNETKATSRVLPLDAPEEKGKCIYCGKAAKYRWYFAQAY